MNCRPLPVVVALAILVGGIVLVGCGKLGGGGDGEGLPIPPPTGGGGGPTGTTLPSGTWESTSWDQASWALDSGAG